MRARVLLSHSLVTSRLLQSRPTARNLACRETTIRTRERGAVNRFTQTCPGFTARARKGGQRLKLQTGTTERPCDWLHSRAGASASLERTIGCSSEDTLLSLLHQKCPPPPAPPPPSQQCLRPFHNLRPWIKVLESLSMRPLLCDVAIRQPHVPH